MPSGQLPVVPRSGCAMALRPALAGMTVFITAWCFSAATVARVPEMFDKLSGKARSEQGRGSNLDSARDLVMTFQDAAGRRDFGVVVDGVSDVVDVNTDEVKAAPDLGAHGATDYIRGLVPVSERMVVLLDIDRLIGNDMTSFSDAPATETASAA